MKYSEVDSTWRALDSYLQHPRVQTEQEARSFLVHRKPGTKILPGRMTGRSRSGGPSPQGKTDNHDKARLVLEVVTERCVLSACRDCCDTQSEI